MKKIILVNLECIGLQILASVFFIIFYNHIMPPKLYSIFTIWLFLWAVYSTFWQLGNKDRKNTIIKNNHLNIGESPLKQNRLKGAIIGFPYFIFNILILLITCVFNNDILITVQSFLLLTFSGFLPYATDTLGNEYFIPRLIVCVIMYISCIAAYFSGSFNFSITDKILPKLIYKNYGNKNK